MGTRLLVAALAVLGLAWAAPVAIRWSTLMTHTPPADVGRPAPAMTLTNPATGESVKLQDYEGQVVLLTLWATWCGPCRGEMAELEAIHREFVDEGLAVVAVSLDPAGSEEAINGLVAELGLSFDVLHDSKELAAGLYQVVGLPHSLVIDKRGVIVKREFGAGSWGGASNRELLVELLKERDSVT